MVHGVEVTSDIHINDPFDRCPFLTNLFESSMRRSSWSEPVRTRFKDGFIDSFQNDPHYFLDEFVVPRRYAERSFLAIFLWHIDPTSWLETVGSVLQPCDD